MTNNIGNITTIIKTISMMFAGYFLGYCVSIGLNLPISQEQLSEIFFTIILFIAAYLDAKYPNTFKILGNNIPDDLPSGETVLNDEYEYDEIGDEDGI